MRHMRHMQQKGNSFSSGPASLSNRPAQIVWDKLTDPPFDPVPPYC